MSGLATEIRPATPKAQSARNDRLGAKAEAVFVYGIVGDAMGTPTESLEAEIIRARFGRVETFEGTGTDDTILRDLLADALIESGGLADGDAWARQWISQDRAIFGQKVGKFFQSVLHTATKLRYGWLPRRAGEGNMPSSSSAMAIAPVGIVNAGHPRAAAAQAFDIASLIHGGEVGFCQDGAAAIAAAIAAGMVDDATAEDAVAAGRDAIRQWSGGELRGLIDDALRLAADQPDEASFRDAYQARFRRPIQCDSRETVPAALALVRLGRGNAWNTCVMGANFGRDTDTIAAMAGAIAGAVEGEAGLAHPGLAGLDASVRTEQRARADALLQCGRLKAEAEIVAWRSALAR